MWFMNGYSMPIITYKKKGREGRGRLHSRVATALGRMPNALLRTMTKTPCHNSSTEKLFFSKKNVPLIPGVPGGVLYS